MLYNKMNYTTNISYLTNVFINEYDISKANINVLYSKRLIDSETYDWLYNAERMTRQVYVGKLQKDKMIADELKAGIIEAKKMLFESNMVNDYEVLSIKNDAVFIINRTLEYTKFGLIEFKLKNRYTSYYKMGNLELYYFYNSINKSEDLEVKGIGDSKLELHKDYFVTFLKDLFYAVQTAGPVVAMGVLKDYYNRYISLSLPVDHYRLFDPVSKFKLNMRSYTNSAYFTEVVQDARSLDITYNATLLLELQKILTDMTLR